MASSILNCTELDASLTALEPVFQGTGSVWSWGPAALLLLLGCVLLVQGEFFVRPIAATVGGVGGVLVSYVLTGWGGMQCDGRLVVASVSGIVLALVAVCVLKTGIFLLGGAALASVTHLVYESLNVTPDPRFEWLGRSGYYYIAIVVASVGGGILSFLQRRKLLRILSSAAGGGCLVLSLHIVWRTTSESSPPSLVSLLVLLTSTLAGCCVQHSLHRRRVSRRRPSRKSRDDNDEEELQTVVGRPVR